MSYPALLSSLRSTPHGDDDDYRTILGTLLRQMFNDDTDLTAPPPGPGRGMAGSGLPVYAGESQRHEAARRGVTLYRVRMDRGASIGKGPYARERAIRRQSARSPTRIIADLRSVGWGGNTKEMRGAIAVVWAAMSMTVRRDCQNRNDLESFNRPPPGPPDGADTWQKVVLSNQNTWLNRFVVIESVDGHPQIQLAGFTTTSLPTVISTLSDAWQAWHQGSTYAEEHGSPEDEEIVVSIEYAGVEHRVRGGRR